MQQQLFEELIDGLIDTFTLLQESLTDRDKLKQFVGYLQYRDNTESSKSQSVDTAIRNVAAVAKVARNINNTLDDINMGRFADKAKNEKRPESEILLSKDAVLSSISQFKVFLESEGESQEDAKRVSALYDRFVKTVLPEIAVLEAVKELREQFHPHPVGQKPTYPGKRACPDARKFLMEHYGEDIENGSLTPGILQSIDKYLYTALYRDLEGTGETVADVVRPRGKPYARRAVACAAILGTADTEEAGRFFGSLRADRVERHMTKKIR